MRNHYDISTKTRNEARMPIIPTLFIIVLEVWGNSIRQKQINQRHKIWKTEGKLLADDIIVYLENLRESVLKLTQVAKEAS